MKVTICFVALTLVGGAAVSAHASGMEIGNYVGTFTNLDPNQGSYMLWHFTFGTPADPYGPYDPFQVGFSVGPYSSGGLGTSGGFGVDYFLSESEVYGATGDFTFADYNIFTYYVDPSDTVGVYCNWSFVDTY